MTVTYLEHEGASSEAVDSSFESNLDFSALIGKSNWLEPGTYYQTMPSTTRAAVDAVVSSDERLKAELRNTYLPGLVSEGTVKRWEKVEPKYIEEIQQKILYPGRVFAADGTISRYETLSLFGAQIAISKINYQGTTGQIACNIMCMGKEVPRNTTAQDIVSAIRSRGRKLKDKLPNVFLYSLMLYKERETLLQSPPGAFKLIHGPIFPYEMLVGSGKQHTMKICFDLIKEIVDDGAYAAIVSSAKNKDLLALGLALEGGEYIIVNSGVDVLNDFFSPDNPDRAHYTSTPIDEYGGKSQIEVFTDFKNTVGNKVVEGVLRAHPMSAPYVFYCNENNLDEAVHMLFADAANTGARGFPLLLDMADQYCSAAFKASEYTTHMNAEFARASRGSGLYQSERTTRD